MPIALAVLTALFAALVTIARFELQYQPKSTVTYANLALIALDLAAICLNINPLVQSVLGWWKRRRDPRLDVERRLDLEKALARRLYGSAILDEPDIELHLREQSFICGIRNARLPNWTTASSGLLAVPFAILLTLYANDRGQHDARLAHLVEHSQAFASLIAFLSAILIASLIQTNDLAQEQELSLRMASTIEKARKSSAITS